MWECEKQNRLRGKFESENICVLAAGISRQLRIFKIMFELSELVGCVLSGMKDDCRQWKKLKSTLISVIRLASQIHGTVPRINSTFNVVVGRNLEKLRDANMWWASTHQISEKTRWYEKQIPLHRTHQLISLPLQTLFLLFIRFDCVLCVLMMLISHVNVQQEKPTKHVPWIFYSTLKYCWNSSNVFILFLLL